MAYEPLLIPGLRRWDTICSVLPPQFTLFIWSLSIMQSVLFQQNPFESLVTLHTFFRASDFFLLIRIIWLYYQNLIFTHIQKKPPSFLTSLFKVILLIFALKFLQFTLLKFGIMILISDSFLDDINSKLETNVSLYSLLSWSNFLYYQGRTLLVTLVSWTS